MLISFNPFSAKDVLLDLTLSNARRFYSSKGNPSALNGLIFQAYTFIYKDYVTKFSKPEQMSKKRTDCFSEDFYTSARKKDGTSVNKSSSMKSI